VDDVEVPADPHAAEPQHVQPAGRQLRIATMPQRT